VLDGPNPSRALQYAGIMVQYFASLAVVDGNPGANSEFNYIEKVEPYYLGDDPDPLLHGEPWPNNPRLQGKITADLVSKPIDLSKQKSLQHQYLLYTGPTKVRLLSYDGGVYEGGMQSGLIERYEHELRLDLLTDAPSNSVFSTLGITRLIVWFTNVMHWVLESLYGITGSYWAAIILMTVLVRALMFPISRKQAMTSLRMQKLAPEMKKLQEKFKDDKQALAAAQMEMYRKYGVNPFSGCLVVLLQMPIFMGLYYALYESVHLRLSSFLWIENLAAPDMLLYWFRWPISLSEFSQSISFGYININFGPYFNLLPLISIILMLFQQKMMTPPPADADQAMQQKMMSYMMIFMGYAFYWVPAGLCIYFTISSGWGLLERRLLPKISHEAADAAANKPIAPAPDKRSKGTEKNGQANGFLGRISDLWNDLLEQAKKK
jgi:YidC/Oxa1 family membrane protein insertase